MTTTEIYSPAVASRNGLFATGLLAAVAAAVAATLVAAVAMSVGVDFELPDGGESIPFWAFAQLTFFFAMVGLVLAAGLRRWSRRPSVTFVRATVVLTAVSLVAPLLADANPGTVAALMVIHLVAAAVFIPLLARKLAS